MRSSVVVCIFISTAFFAKLAASATTFDTSSTYLRAKNEGISFQVRGTKDVHIELASSATEAGKITEIVIGVWGNTKSAIRYEHEDQYVAPTPGILDADEFRGFWIEWRGSFINVGRKGNYQPFMTWQSLEPIPVRYVNFHSGWGASGSWIIDDKMAKDDIVPKTGFGGAVGSLYIAPKIGFGGALGSLHDTAQKTGFRDFERGL